MLTLEYILVFAAMAGSLAIILPAMHMHTEKIEAAARIFHDHALGSECSARADHAGERFLLISARGCWAYPQTLDDSPSPFTITLGRDANHYA